MPLPLACPCPVTFCEGKFWAGGLIRGGQHSPASQLCLLPVSVGHSCCPVAAARPVRPCLRTLLSQASVRFACPCSLPVPQPRLDTLDVRTPPSSALPFSPRFARPPSIFLGCCAGDPYTPLLPATHLTVGLVQPTFAHRTPPSRGQPARGCFGTWLARPPGLVFTMRSLHLHHH